MELKGKLAKDKYAHDRNNETHLLVELKAPKVDWEKDRAPICVLPVLDVSGSMSGQKIDYVRKACRKLMNHLAPGDFAGLVSFDSFVHPIAEPREITQEQKDNLKKMVDELHAGSCTNMSGGLFQALEWINKLDLPDKFILRVILFTDGHANVGITGRNLLEAAEKQKGRASISAFGFGNDCDQELLADIANKCGGNYAFIDSPDTAMAAFARELGGLMSTYAQNISVKISPDKNNKVLEILNDEDVVEDKGVTTVQLQDILGEESKYIVAKVQLNEVEKPLPRKVNAFKVDVSYTDKEGSKQDLKTMAVKVKFCKADEEPTEEDADVVKHRDRLLAGRAQDQAEIYARMGNYEGARGVMLDCFNSISDEGVKGLVNSVGVNYLSAESYNASHGTTKAVRQGLKKGRVMSYSSSDAAEVKTSGAISNTAMDDMVNSFTAGDGDDWDVNGVSAYPNDLNGSIMVSSDPDPSVSIAVDKEEEKKEEKGSSKKRSNRDW